MTTDELIEHWNSSESPEMNFYDAIDLLDNSIAEIRSGVPYTDEQLLDLRAVHLFTIQISLGLSSAYQSFDSMNSRKTFHDLAYLISKYELPCLKGIECEKEDIVKKNIYGDFGIGYKDTDTNALENIEKRVALFKEKRESLLFSPDKTTDYISYTESDSPLDDCITSLGLISSRDIFSCYFYIPEIKETDLFLNSAINRILQKSEAKINQITKLLDAIEKEKKKDKQIKKVKKPDKLVSPNNNPSWKVFGNSNSKLKENETPYYSVAYTPEELLESRSLISTTFARDITVKDTKTLTGQLALMSSVDRSIQQERFKPMLSAPLTAFDRYVYSNTVACLRNYINKKVEVDLLLTSFSGTDRIREETDFTRSFVNSLTKMRSTSVFFEYRTKNKIVSILEPLLSFTLKKEIDAKTGKEKNYIILHKMPEFFEWAESLKQVISIPEKLFRVEYKKNGKTSRLRQTKRNTLLLNHLLEHISNFRYYFENKNKRDSEEEDSPERFSKILFETLCEVTETKTKDEKRELPFTIEHCFEYWKKCNLVDYKFEWEDAKGGRRLVAIHLFYPEDPRLTLS